MLWSHYDTEDEEAAQKVTVREHEDRPLDSLTLSAVLYLDTVMNYVVHTSPGREQPSSSVYPSG